MFFLLSFALSSVEEDIISELKSIHSSLRDIRTLLEAQRLSEPRLPILRPVIRPRLSNRLANSHILYYSNEPELSDSDPGTWGGPWPARLTNEPEPDDNTYFIQEKPRQLVPGLEFPSLPKRRIYNRAAFRKNLFEIIPEDADEIAEEVEEEQIKKADHSLHIIGASLRSLPVNSKKAQKNITPTSGNKIIDSRPPPSFCNLGLFERK